jgi:hypothetical protein
MMMKRDGGRVHGTTKSRRGVITVDTAARHNEGCRMQKVRQKPESSGELWMPGGEMRGKLGP